MLRSSGLLVDTVLREAVVEIRAFGRVVDDLQAFLDFTSLEYLLATAACVKATRTVRLSIVTPFALATRVLAADEIIDAHDFHLG